MNKHNFRAVRAKGRMNKLEEAYSEHLEARKQAGEIRGYWYEALKLNLAPGLACTYTPDFLVQRADDVLELHEVKGHWEDDARVKIKIAASKYPFYFIAVTRPSLKRGWAFETFQN